MTKPTSSSAELALYYIAIAISAILMLSPTARALPFAKVVVSLINLALLACWIRRDRKTGNGRLTLPEIYSKARQGQRFASSAVESAATTVTIIAFWLTI
jgi:hypothetical protein